MPRETATLQTLTDLQAALATAEITAVDSDGHLLIDPEVAATYLLKNRPPAKMKEQRWDTAGAKAIWAVAQAHIPEPIAQLAKQTTEHYPGSRKEVPVAADLKALFSKQAINDLEQIARKAAKEHLESGIIIYGNIFIINNQKIFYIEKVSSPEEQSQHQGAVDWQPGQDKQYDVIGILHCHLPEFTQQIHAAFSGTGDFRMALDNAFEGEIGNSQYTNYLTGVVTFTNRGIQMGIYHFNQEEGETYFGQKAIKGRMEKLPGVFFVDDSGPETADALYFHQTPVFPNFQPNRTIGETYLLAQAATDGNYHLSANWSENSTGPNTANRRTASTDRGEQPTTEITPPQTPGLTPTEPALANYPQPQLPARRPDPDNHYRPRRQEPN